MMTRDEILAVYAAGPEPVVALVEALLARLTQQEEQLHALTTRVQELEARLAKDSHNSHQPPASDGLARKPKSLRASPTGRRPGAQPGHRGTTLRWVATPDHQEAHVPATCHQCGTALGAVAPRRVERRQVHDLPPLQLQVTEHQAQTKVCPACQATTTAPFPVGVEQPVQYGPRLKALAVYLQEYQLLPLARTRELLADLFGSAPCEGTLAAARWQCHLRLAPVEAAIQQALQRAPVAHFDETGVRVGKQTQWLHQAGTATLTYYAVQPQRGRTATDRIGILPTFRGTAVHDAWPSYFGYACRHALCNAHLLRELTFVAEQGDQPWAREMIGLLCEIKAAVAAAQTAGQTRLVAAEQERWEHRYQTLIATGLARNPPPIPTGKRGRPKQSPAKNLLDRLDKHRAAVLAFMHDFAVPFDNNLAERDLRMVKVQQKISGCFRSAEGAAAFCRIRGYISTLRKQGDHLLTALQTVFAGQPYSPQLQPE
jgi:transposase